MSKVGEILALGAVGYLLMAPSPASALGNKVIINCDNGDWVCNDNFTAFSDALTAEGAIVEVHTEVPSIIASGDVRLLVISLPTNGWDLNPTITQYITPFLSAGGRLVLLGDGELEEANGNALLRSLLDTIPNHGLILEANQSNNNGSCADAPTTLIQGDPLTAGVTSWHVAQTNSVTGGDPLINFVSDDGGDVRTLAAVARLPNGGEIILFGDNEAIVGGLFYDVCGDLGTDIPSVHATLWSNLYADQSSPVDTDNDGYDSNEDCDDDNANVNPGATEECNGVDDNCDGIIDEGCDDDDDATADDDDATSNDDDATGDDDDTTDGLTDDDDTSDPVRDDGQWNACSCGEGSAIASVRPSAWLLAVLPLGGLLSLRRRRHDSP